MALVVERRVTTTNSIEPKAQLCHTCRERKSQLFTIGVDGKPICADCCRKIGRPID